MLATLFVYGTLRSGQSNAKLLEGRGHCAGPAAIRGTLYFISPYPGLVDGEGEVRGELFVLSDPGGSLPELDSFEGEEYQRLERETVRPDGSRVQAWVYLYRGATATSTLIASGDWVATRFPS